MHLAGLDRQGNVVERDERPEFFRQATQSEDGRRFIHSKRFMRSTDVRLSDIRPRDQPVTITCLIRKTSNARIASTGQSLNLAADDIPFHLVDLRRYLRGRLTKHDIRRGRASFEAVGEEPGGPGTAQESRDLVLDDMARASDREPYIDRIAAASVDIASQNMRALFARRLLNAAQSEIHDVIMHVGAFANCSQRCFLGLCDIIEVACKAREIFDVRINRARSIAKLDAGVDDWREFDAADEADDTRFAQQGGGDSGDITDLR